MKSKGFTLIELLIVVSLIFIIIAFSIPNYLKTYQKAKITEVKLNMRIFQEITELLAFDNNGLYYQKPESVVNYAKKKGLWKNLINPFTGRETLIIDLSISSIISPGDIGYYAGKSYLQVFENRFLLSYKLAYNNFSELMTDYNFNNSPDRYYILGSDYQGNFLIHSNEVYVLTNGNYQRNNNADIENKEKANNSDNRYNGNGKKKGFM